jgi:cobalamin biosynthesis protein CobW
VGRRFDSYFDRRWQAGEANRSRFVLIGEDLDQPALQRAFDAALEVAMAAAAANEA